MGVKPCLLTMATRPNRFLRSKLCPGVLLIATVLVRFRETMNTWSIVTCRACLLQDSVAAMFDLAVSETLRLYQECTGTRITVSCLQTFHCIMHCVTQCFFQYMEPDTAQHLCSMCYRLCELWQGFKDRCLESERKLNRVSARRIAEENAKKAKPQRLQQPLEGEEPRRLDPNPTESQETKDETMSDVSFQPAEMYMEPAEVVKTVEIEIAESELSEEEDLKPPLPKAKKSRFSRRETPPPISRTPQTTDSEKLTFIPGPNSKGVWNYFDRDTTKKYGKCKDCGQITATPNASTTGLRSHLERRHFIILPKRKNESM